MAFRSMEPYSISVARGMVQVRAPQGDSLRNESCRRWRARLSARASTIFRRTNTVSNAQIQYLGVSRYPRNLCAFCAHVCDWFGGPRSVVAVHGALTDATAARPSSRPSAYIPLVAAIGHFRLLALSDHSDDLGAFLWPTWRRLRWLRWRAGPIVRRPIEPDNLFFLFGLRVVLSELCFTSSLRRRFARYLLEHTQAAQSTDQPGKLIARLWPPQQETAGIS
jgi:hypothetical protein